MRTAELWLSFHQLRIRLGYRVGSLDGIPLRGDRRDKDRLAAALARAGKIEAKAKPRQPLELHGIQAADDPFRMRSGEAGIEPARQLNIQGNIS